MPPGATIETEWTYKGVDTAILENEYLRIVILTGKGSDIIEFRDKRRDVNVLFDPPFEWTPPTERTIPSEQPTTWQTDHYPGGWQVNLPIAGYGAEIKGSAYGLHGESALRAWETTLVREDEQGVGLRLELDLLRYPFRIERDVSLAADAPTVTIEETITNQSNIDLEYIWQQHVALGTPLVGPGARLDVPAVEGVVGKGEDEYARLQSGAAFEWPTAPLAAGETIDLATAFPEQDAEIHDIAYATDLEAGWFALTNQDLDLGFACTFPTDPFECLWYWQAFGGYEDAPFYKRNYNIGLEPTTAYPGSNLFEAQRNNETIDVLEGGDSISATFTARTYTNVTAVGDVATDGTITES